MLMPMLFERLIAHWAAHGGAARPGVSLDRLDAFEARYGVLLPDDLRVYFTLCNGTEWPTTDPHDYRAMTEFWSLDRVRPAIPWVQEDMPAQNSRSSSDDLGVSSSYFIIADYCIVAAIYSIRLTPDLGAGNPVVIGPYSREYEGTPLATSFTEFVELYLDDPEALVGGQRSSNTRT